MGGGLWWGSRWSRGEAASAVALWGVGPTLPDRVSTVLGFGMSRDVARAWTAAASVACQLLRCCRRVCLWVGVAAARPCLLGAMQRWIEASFPAAFAALARGAGARVWQRGQWPGTAAEQ